MFSRFQIVNFKSYRRLRGLPNQQIIVKKASELIPNLKEEFFDCEIKCGEVALTGRSLSFEKRCSANGKWFSVNAYSPEKVYFTMAIKDVTGRKKPNRRSDKAKNNTEYLPTA